MITSNKSLSLLVVFLFLPISLIMSQEIIKCNLLLDSKSWVGEGAIWDYKNDRLLWIDIEQQYLHVYYPADSTKNISIKTPAKIGTVVPFTKDTCIVALNDGIYSYSFSQNTFIKLSDIIIDTSLNRFNDGKCGPDSRLWVGTMHKSAQKPTGSLYCFDKKIKAKEVLTGITVSNGISWSPDGTKMYYIDSPTSKVVQYDYDSKSGKISNPKDIINIPLEYGTPDGSTIDENGNLWIAMWNGGNVGCWNPNTGKLIQVITVPAWNITSIAFGGKDLDTLYITSAKLWIPTGYDKKFPLSGGLFTCKPGVKGIQANYFKQK